MEITISDDKLRQAASEGMDAFLKAFTNAYHEAIGGTLTAETMGELNTSQITLLAYETLHEEVMDGGFVQLIHNGYGPFIFRNPFAKVLRMWGLRDLSKLIYEGGHLYGRYGAEIERECSDDEFMALFERFPDFDDLDDAFVEHEEEYTAALACYVDDHLSEFISNPIA